MAAKHIPHLQGFLEKSKAKAAGKLFERLRQMGAFGLWANIPDTEKSFELARNLRKRQTRYSG